ncbi:MAG: HEAT repeat domain-containing protein [Actinomycetota bacterium]
MRKRRNISHVSTAPGSEPFGTEELSRALRDPDPFVRVAALHRAAPEDTSVETIGSALGDDYPLVRREAVRSLSRIGTTEAVRVLLQVSAHDLSAEVREEAVTALAGILRVGSAGADTASG